jgi:hypothetical protein
MTRRTASPTNIKFEAKTKTMKKSAPPAVSEIAFNCPHCGAYTAQTWYTVTASRISGERAVPAIADESILQRIEDDDELPQEAKEEGLRVFRRLIAGDVFFDTDKGYVEIGVANLFVSKCFVCTNLGIWVRDRLLFPVAATGPEPQPDLPPDVRADYDEASQILANSPRGAAALLRLAIQKLCVHLDESGKDLNQDIGALVKKGLSPIVQKSLDVVRVIGNEAVHPGTLDLRDNREIAAGLFRLVNIISEQMIAHPKHVNELYSRLPEAKLKGIQERDGDKQK